MNISIFCHAHKALHGYTTIFIECRHYHHVVCIVECMYVLKNNHASIKGKYQFSSSNPLRVFDDTNTYIYIYIYIESFSRRSIAFTRDAGGFRDHDSPSLDGTPSLSPHHHLHYHLHSPPLLPLSSSWHDGFVPARPLPRFLLLLRQLFQGVATDRSMPRLGQSPGCPYG
jgi:hypothetical protein